MQFTDPPDNPLDSKQSAVNVFNAPREDSGITSNPGGPSLEYISKERVIEFIQGLVTNYTQVKHIISELGQQPVVKVLLPLIPSQNHPKAFITANLRTGSVMQRTHSSASMKLTIQQAISECDQSIHEYSKALDLFYDDIIESFETETNKQYQKELSKYCTESGLKSDEEEMKTTRQQPAKNLISEEQLRETWRQMEEQERQKLMQEYWVEEYSDHESDHSLDDYGPNKGVEDIYDQLASKYVHFSKDIQYFLDGGEKKSNPSDTPWKSSPKVESSGLVPAPVVPTIPNKNLMSLNSGKRTGIYLNKQSQTNESKYHQNRSHSVESTSSSQLSNLTPETPPRPKTPLLDACVRNARKISPTSEKNQDRNPTRNTKLTQSVEISPNNVLKHPDLGKTTKEYPQSTPQVGAPVNYYPNPTYVHEPEKLVQNPVDKLAETPCSSAFETVYVEEPPYEYYIDDLSSREFNPAQNQPDTAAFPISSPNSARPFQTIIAQPEEIFMSNYPQNTFYSPTCDNFVPYSHNTYTNGPYDSDNYQPFVNYSQTHSGMIYPESTPPAAAELPAGNIIYQSIRPDNVVYYNGQPFLAISQSQEAFPARTHDMSSFSSPYQSTELLYHPVQMQEVPPSLSVEAPRVQSETSVPNNFDYELNSNVINKQYDPRNKFIPQTGVIPDCQEKVSSKPYYENYEVITYGGVGVQSETDGILYTQRVEETVTNKLQNTTSLEGRSSFYIAQREPSSTMSASVEQKYVNYTEYYFPTHQIIRHESNWTENPKQSGEITPENLDENSGGEFYYYPVNTWPTNSKHVSSENSPQRSPKEAPSEQIAPTQPTIPEESTDVPRNSDTGSRFYQKLEQLINERNNNHTKQITAKSLKNIPKPNIMPDERMKKDLSKKFINYGKYEIVCCHENYESSGRSTRNTINTHPSISQPPIVRPSEIITSPIGDCKNAQEYVQNLNVAPPESRSPIIWESSSSKATVDSEMLVVKSPLPTAEETWASPPKIREEVRQNDKIPPNNPPIRSLVVANSSYKHHSPRNSNHTKYSPNENHQSPFRWQKSAPRRNYHGKQIERSSEVNTYEIPPKRQNTLQSVNTPGKTAIKAMEPVENSVQPVEVNSKSGGSPVRTVEINKQPPRSPGRAVENQSKFVEPLIGSTEKLNGPASNVPSSPSKQQQNVSLKETATHSPLKRQKWTNRRIIESPPKRLKSMESVSRNSPELDNKESVAAKSSSTHIKSLPAEVCKRENFKPLPQRRPKQAKEVPQELKFTSSEKIISSTIESKPEFETVIRGQVADEVSKHEFKQPSSPVKKVVTYGNFEIVSANESYVSAKPKVGKLKERSELLDYIRSATKSHNKDIYSALPKSNKLITSNMFASNAPEENTIDKPNPPIQPTSIQVEDKQTTEVKSARNIPKINQCEPEANLPAVPEHKTEIVIEPVIRYDQHNLQRNVASIKDSRVTDARSLNHPRETKPKMIYKRNADKTFKPKFKPSSTKEIVEAMSASLPKPIVMQASAVSYKEADRRDEIRDAKDKDLLEIFAQYSVGNKKSSKPEVKRPISEAVSRDQGMTCKANRIPTVSEVESQIFLKSKRQVVPLQETTKVIKILQRDASESELQKFTGKVPKQRKEEEAPSKLGKKNRVKVLPENTPPPINDWALEVEMEFGNNTSPASEIPIKEQPQNVNANSNKKPAFLGERGSQDDGDPLPQAQHKEPCAPIDSDAARLIRIREIKKLKKLKVKETLKLSKTQNTAPHKPLDETQVPSDPHRAPALAMPSMCDRTNVVEPPQTDRSHGRKPRTEQQAVIVTTSSTTIGGRPTKGQRENSSHVQGLGPKKAHVSIKVSQTDCRKNKTRLECQPSTTPASTTAVTRPETPVQHPSENRKESNTKSVPELKLSKLLLEYEKFSQQDSPPNVPAELNLETFLDEFSTFTKQIAAAETPNDIHNLGELYINTPLSDIHTINTQTPSAVPTQPNRSEQKEIIPAGTFNNTLIHQAPVDKSNNKTTRSIKGKINPKATIADVAICHKPTKLAEVAEQADCRNIPKALSMDLMKLSPGCSVLSKSNPTSLTDYTSHENKEFGCEPVPLKSYTKPETSEENDLTPITLAEKPNVDDCGADHGLQKEALPHQQVKRKPPKCSSSNVLQVDPQKIEEAGDLTLPKSYTTQQKDSEENLTPITLAEKPNLDDCADHGLQKKSLPHQQVKPEPAKCSSSNILQVDPQKIEEAGDLTLPKSDTTQQKTSEENLTPITLAEKPILDDLADYGLQKETLPQQQVKREPVKGSSTYVLEVDPPKIEEEASDHTVPKSYTTKQENSEENLTPITLADKPILDDLADYGLQKESLPQQQVKPEPAKCSFSNILQVDPQKIEEAGDPTLPKYYTKQENADENLTPITLADKPILDDLADYGLQKESLPQQQVKPEPAKCSFSNILQVDPQKIEEEAGDPTLPKYYTKQENADENLTPITLAEKPILDDLADYGLQKESLPQQQVKREPVKCSSSYVLEVDPPKIEEEASDHTVPKSYTTKQENSDENLTPITLAETPILDDLADYGLQKETLSQQQVKSEPAKCSSSYVLEVDPHKIEKDSEEMRLLTTLEKWAITTQLESFPSEVACASSDHSSWYALPPSPEEQQEFSDDVITVKTGLDGTPTDNFYQVLDEISARNQLKLLDSCHQHKEIQTGESLENINDVKAPDVAAVHHTLVASKRLSSPNFSKIPQLTSSPVAEYLKVANTDMKKSRSVETPLANTNVNLPSEPPKCRDVPRKSPPETPPDVKNDVKKQAFNRKIRFNAVRTQRKRQQNLDDLLGVPTNLPKPTKNRRRLQNKSNDSSPVRISATTKLLRPNTIPPIELSEQHTKQLGMCAASVASMAKELFSASTEIKSRMSTNTLDISAMRARDTGIVRMPPITTCDIKPSSGVGRKRPEKLAPTIQNPAKKTLRYSSAMPSPTKNGTSPTRTSKKASVTVVKKSTKNDKSSHSTPLLIPKTTYPEIHLPIDHDSPSTQVSEEQLKIYRQMIARKPVNSPPKANETVEVSERKHGVLPKTSVKQKMVKNGCKVKKSSHGKSGLSNIEEKGKGLILQAKDVVTHVKNMIIEQNKYKSVECVHGSASQVNQEVRESSNALQDSARAFNQANQVECKQMDLIEGIEPSEIEHRKIPECIPERGASTSQGGVPTPKLTDEHEGSIGDNLNALHVEILEEQKINVEPLKGGDNEESNSFTIQSNTVTKQIVGEIKERMQEKKAHIPFEHLSKTVNTSIDDIFSGKLYPINQIAGHKLSTSPNEMVLTEGIKSPEVGFLPSSTPGDPPKYLLFDVSRQYEYTIRTGDIEHRLLIFEDVADVQKYFWQYQNTSWGIQQRFMQVVEVYNDQEVETGSIFQCVGKLLIHHGIRVHTHVIIDDVNVESFLVLIITNGEDKAGSVAASNGGDRCQVFFHSFNNEAVVSTNAMYTATVFSLKLNCEYKVRCKEDLFKVVVYTDNNQAVCQLTPSEEDLPELVPCECPTADHATSSDPVIELEISNTETVPGQDTGDISVVLDSESLRANILKYCHGKDGVLDEFHIREVSTQHFLANSADKTTGFFVQSGYGASGEDEGAEDGEVLILNNFWMHCFDLASTPDS